MATGDLRGIFRPGKTYILVHPAIAHPQEDARRSQSTFAWVIPTPLYCQRGRYFLARKSLAPVVAMSARPGASVPNPHERLAVQNDRTNWGPWRILHSLLDRLSQSFERQRVSWPMRRTNADAGCDFAR